MNVEISKQSVKASVIKKEVRNNKDEGNTTNKYLDESDEGNNNETKQFRPMLDELERKVEVLQKQCNDHYECNRIMKKQLISRDEILKQQIASILDLKAENKKQIQCNQAMKRENEILRKELEAEKWLTEKLRQDVRDFQVQIDFEDCYVEEQTYKNKMLETMLNEVQKLNKAQQEEIVELKEQLNRTQEQLDNQIIDLQDMLRT